MMMRGRNTIQTEGGLQRGMTAGLQTERQKQRRDMWGEKASHEAKMCCVQEEETGLNQSTGRNV